MIDFADVIKAYIDSVHGWAVADQFQSTFYDQESFEDQNKNALVYIRQCVANIINSKILHDDAQAELQEYYANLVYYLNS